MAAIKSAEKLLAAQRAWRDAIAAGQVIESVERRLCFLHALPQDFNAGFGSDGYIAFIEIYAAGCIPETFGIFQRLLVSAELSLSVFELIAQLRGLRGVPSRVVGFHVRLTKRYRLWHLFVPSAHDANQAEIMQFFELVIGPNYHVLDIRF
jgi:hypothetical protein